MAVLDKLGLTDVVTPKIVTGENITQTQQFVESGSAELGFVALSQVVGKPAARVWVPPQEDYPAIRQNAVLLKTGAGNDAAKAFLDYLKSDEAVAVILVLTVTLGSTVPGAIGRAPVHVQATVWPLTVQDHVLPVAPAAVGVTPEGNARVTLGFVVSWAPLEATVEARGGSVFVTP